MPHHVRVNLARPGRVIPGEMKQLAFAILLIAAQPAAAAQPRVQALQPRKPASNPPIVTKTGEADPRAPGFDDQNARETRDQFTQLLRQYPPSLAEVLRLDPSLLTNEGYL